MEHTFVDSIKDFVVENVKAVIVLIFSIIGAHSPLPEFVEYDWNAWVPFLNFLKLILTIIGMVVSTVFIILNYLKKKHDKTQL